MDTLFLPACVIVVFLFTHDQCNNTSRSKLFSCRFTYASVQYTAFHAKKFTALISSPSNGTSHPEQVDFELQSRSTAQALYRTITEFHTFFKRDSVGRVVKTAGFCKSLLGNFKGQNPDRFYFDVTKTHKEVVDHVWATLHASTRVIQNNDSNITNAPPSSSGLVPPNSRGHHHHHTHHRSSSSASSSRNHSNHSHQQQRRGSTGTSHHSALPPLPSSSPNPEESSSQEVPPPLPPNRHSSRGSGSSSMHRSQSVQDSSALRPPNLTYLPPLPPYSQRSSSSDALIRPSGSNGSRRPHIRTIPFHGPHMASTASFNPYLSPSISETGSDGEEEDLYTGGGSECYVTMSSCSDTQTYLPSTRSDPGTSSTLDRRMFRLNHSHSMSNSNHNTTPPGSRTMLPSETSGELYITSGDSECSGASYRVSSPPPLYREVDEEHTVPLNFDNTTGSVTGGDDAPNSASIRLVSPIIPVQGGADTTVFNFDAAAVLTRTRELEGELQRLRTAMTCRLCRQNPIGATFCPCGHTVCCYQCAQHMGNCWECDVTITSVQRMLLTR